MSLFPAYTTNTIQDDDEVGATATSSSWLTNISFAETMEKKEPSSGEDSCCSVAELNLTKPKKKHKPTKEVDNSVFFVDRKPLRTYLSVRTLKKPGCPKYHVSVEYRLCRRPKFCHQSKNRKRYFVAVKKMHKKEKSKDQTQSIEDEELQILKYLKTNPKDTVQWLKYIEFRDGQMTDTFQKEKSKLEIAEKALKCNPECENLLRTYLELLPKVHPTDEVLQIIGKLVKNNPHNFLHWNALIFNKQTSMSQCIVPDVLKEYEKCLSALFSVVKNDEILIQLFKNCALFLRQSGLWEQFFATIQLVLNLNVSESAFVSTNSATTDATLIEYEELILKSGLPLNEIWLRIEKLRSAYNFLPCVRGDLVKSDPQRLVLNEDICGFVFPLTNKSYSFGLFLLILNLLKYPFSRLPFYSEEVYENENIEKILPTFLEIKRDPLLDLIIFNSIKDLQEPPTYLNTNLAHHSYRDMLFDIILKGSTCFNAKQNIILFKLYLQLERILIVLEKLGSKEHSSLSIEYKKKLRNRIKAAIKNNDYQTNLQIYAEYCWIEYELEGFSAAQNVFQKIIQQNFIDSNEFIALCLSYVELLMSESETEQAINVLTGIWLNKVHFEKLTCVQNTKKLFVLQKMTESLEEIMTASEEDLFDIEDYFAPSKLLLMIKCKIYYKTLIQSTNEAISDLRDLLRIFSKQNQKHKFLKEKLYEIAAFLHNTVDNNSNNKLFLKLIKEGLQEFPQNLTLLRVFVSDLNNSWMNIKMHLFKCPTSNSVIFLIFACKYRCAKYTLYDESNCERTYKMRVINLLENSTNKRSKIRQNALLWRLYLRTLFEDNTRDTLVKCKNTLYEALDVCPWNKTLYLDGAFYCPQDLSQLMDLIIEKQLRIHAIPEELEILRKH